MQQRDRRARPTTRARTVLAALAVALGLATLAVAPAPARTAVTSHRVQVNHRGYLPTGPKRATLVSSATSPVTWRLQDRNGHVVAHGRTVPRGLDAASGQREHTIDFASAHVTGTRFRLLADGSRSIPFPIRAGLYKDVRTASKTLFYTQRSGTAIRAALVPGYGRTAGHLGVLPNRGDTAAVCQPLDDPSQQLLIDAGQAPWTCTGTHDVRGGWYDAADYGKYTTNGAFTVALLLSEYERSRLAPTGDKKAYADGTLRIPERHNGVPDLLDEVAWELRFLLRMQVPKGQPYAGMLYHKVADADWIAQVAPDQDPQLRMLFRPSAGATWEFAAVAAQGARLYRPYRPALAAQLLQAARTAYDAAGANPDLNAPPDSGSDPNPGSGAYTDGYLEDTRYWASAELYLTTHEARFLTDLHGNWIHGAATDYAFPPGGFSYADVTALARLDLAMVPSPLPDRAAVRRSVIAAADGYVADAHSEPYGMPYALARIGSYSWGSNSAILNNLRVIATAYDLTGRARYRTAALEGLDYIFGRNAIGRGYVTGFGANATKNAESRIYAAQVNPATPHPPRGTMPGGANSSAIDPALSGCVHQTCYLDDWGSWTTNELAINYQASLSWMAGFAATAG